jgi:hypothetical protein
MAYYASGAQEEDRDGKVRRNDIDFALFSSA